MEEANQKAQKLKVVNSSNEDKNTQALKDIYGIKKLMQENELLLVYHDDFNAESYDELLQLTEMKIAAVKGEKKLKKRVFHIMVECVQNISRHAAVSKQIDLKTSSIFVIGKEGDHFFIITGNLIEKDKVEPLRSKIERINNLDNDGLKDLYKETITTQSHNDAGGANLGLIDMARKSGGKIEYHFREVDDEHSFFTFKVNINAHH